MTETSDSEEVYTRQRRIAQLARQMPGKALTSLNQHLDLAWLARLTGERARTGRRAWTARRLRTTRGTWRATSGRSWNARSLARTERRRSEGSFPKGSGAKRGPSAFHVGGQSVQRAVVMLLGPIYERDFYDCSYGFRPHCSARIFGQPLEADDVGGVSSILEVDSGSF